MPVPRFLDAARARAIARLPGVCAVCHGWGTQRVCAECVRRFVREVPRCRRCALEVPAGVDECGACLIDPPPCSGTLAAVDYGHPWDGLVTRFKFHDALDLARSLTERMAHAVRSDGAALPDLLLPMPLADALLRERGFNQAWELTRRLAASLGLAADAKLLLRVRDTKHQLDLPLDQRADNVRAAFAVEPRRLGEMRGRHVALIDDVMTTGATAAEATRALLQAGAADVRVWVVARTPRPGAA